MNGQSIFEDKPAQSIGDLAVAFAEEHDGDRRRRNNQGTGRAMDARNEVLRRESHETDL
jgi:hypothetical protein